MHRLAHACVDFESTQGSHASGREVGLWSLGTSGGGVEEREIAGTSR